MTRNPSAHASLLAAVRRAPARVLIFVIELYRSYVSPTRMPTCRFTPTCSEYAVEAVRDRGAVVGLTLTLVRLLKCGPWHPGGWDPVPPRRSHRRSEHRDRDTHREHGDRDAHREHGDRDTCKQPHDLVSVGEQRST